MHWAVLLCIVTYFGKYLHSNTNWSVSSVSDIACYVQIHANIRSDRLTMEEQYHLFTQKKCSKGYEM